jgi:ABC-type spermidine/putrescine transport system permease subunit II
LSGFAMLVVLTENPDLARTWIEQVQPVLGNSPMIMVLSAQAEPLVRPYYESGSPQVQGLVVGLVSGASYESLLGREGIAARYWDSFSVGMLVAALLILVGGGISIILARLERTKKTVEGKTKA